MKECFALLNPLLNGHGSFTLFPVSKSDGAERLLNFELRTLAHFEFS